MTHPGAVRKTIQPMPGKSHAAATAQPRQNLFAAGCPASKTVEEEDRREEQRPPSPRWQ